MYLKFEGLIINILAFIIKHAVIRQELQESLRKWHTQPKWILLNVPGEVSETWQTR